MPIKRSQMKPSPLANTRDYGGFCGGEACAIGDHPRLTWRVRGAESATG
jgi:hypothetical protein